VNLSAKGKVRSISYKTTKKARAFRNTRENILSSREKSWAATRPGSGPGTTKNPNGKGERQAKIKKDFEKLLPKKRNHGPYPRTQCREGPCWGSLEARGAHSDLKGLRVRKGRPS